MPLAIRNAPSSIDEKFARGMNILAGSPGHDSKNTSYSHIGPFPKRVLASLPRTAADLDSAAGSGWQYLVNDAQGYGVVDISNKPNGTYSAFRRGDFAAAYHEALAIVDYHASGAEEVFELEVVEIPTEFTCVITLRGQELEFYPAYLRGRRLVPDRRTLEEFQALASGASHQSNSGPSPI
ncbi:Hypothetical protein NGAL_HAMBI2610_36170 [Neorhizobium galegae bv. orientalis]|nr:Hypothetical protein NGAL_HAMBI2610_36170 [Neorhizobium galegae bv. orientalis]